MTTKQIEIYKYIINLILEGKYQSGKHSRRWFMSKFDVPKTTIEKVLTLLVNRGILVSYQGSGYEVQPDWIAYANFDKNTKSTISIESIEFVAEYTRLRRSATIDSTPYYFSYSKFKSHTKPTESDLTDGVMNYLEKNKIYGMQSLKSMKVVKDERFDNGISLRVNSKTYSFDNKLIEESEIHFNTDLYEEKYIKNW